MNVLEHQGWVGTRQHYRGDGTPKKRYLTGALAEQAALNMMMRFDGYVFWPYKCDWCTDWHIGRKSA